MDEIDELKYIILQARSADTSLAPYDSVLDEDTLLNEERTTYLKIFWIIEDQSQVIEVWKFVSFRSDEDENEINNEDYDTTRRIVTSFANIFPSAYICKSTLSSTDKVPPFLTLYMETIDNKSWIECEKYGGVFEFKALYNLKIKNYQKYNNKLNILVYYLDEEWLSWGFKGKISQIFSNTPNFKTIVLSNISHDRYEDNSPIRKRDDNKEQHVEEEKAYKIHTDSDHIDVYDHLNRTENIDDDDGEWETLTYTPPSLAPALKRSMADIASRTASGIPIVFGLKKGSSSIEGGLGFMLDNKKDEEGGCVSPFHVPK
tara:strand:- start:1753 stop:2700 length:948 start_codon:yes stop_codon:yes gene_type:complete